MSHIFPQNNIPTIIIVFGATGDLMAKKIIPSLFHLSLQDKIPNQFRVVGVARRSFTDKAFREYVAKILTEHKNTHATDKDPKEFLNIFSYLEGDFADRATYYALEEKLKVIDAEWGVCANKVIYLAVPPEQFRPIFKGLAVSGLNKPCGGSLGWTRALIEKPFGRDSTSARQLETLLARYFKEEQLYRIDHYLAKELIQGIFHFRFSNSLLESSWSNRDVEKIEIRLLETLGVEARGSFYDAVGALRDVGQNHVLEMLAALTMDRPTSMSPTELRAKRAALMGSLEQWTNVAIRKNTFRAQYEGYRAIAGVSPSSATDTYFKLKTELRSPRWKGVPIFLEAGKRCAESRKEIVVTFKHPDTCLMCTAEHHTQNKVVFSLEPQDRISIHFWTKKPGYENSLEERAFTFFVYEQTVKTQYVEEYSKLILGCILGDQTLFVSGEEVRAEWRFIDPVLKAWNKNAVPLNRYKAGSNEMVQAALHVGAGSAPPPLAKEMVIVGLGKMGANMARRMMEKGWRIVGYNRSPESVKELSREGMVPAESVADAIKKLDTRRKIVWLMVPAGKPVDDVLFGKDGLGHVLKRGDIIIDGGNSYYKDTILREKKLRRKGIAFLDCGTSGGPGGARNGACLMIGGDQKNFLATETLFKDFAQPNGYQFFSGPGAGHFVKMAHNGIEYGMMQAIAEGLSVLKKARFHLDLSRVADIYNNGSVIESRLIGWLKSAFELYGTDLASVSEAVNQLGEGRWTVKTAHELGVADKVIHEALLFRDRSKKHPQGYTGKVVSALRNQFGGHEVMKKQKHKAA